MPTRRMPLSRLRASARRRAQRGGCRRCGRWPTSRGDPAVRPALGRCGRRRCLFLASGGASMPKCWHVSAGGREPGLMFRRFVSAQTVVNDGDLRQRKISERDALVIGGKQNDVREHVANLADNLEQDCVLCVCHGSTRASSANRATAALVAVATAQQETAGTVLRLRR